MATTRTIADNVELYDQLIEDHPLDARYRFMLQYPLDGLGRLLRGRDALDESVSHLRRGIDIGEELAVQFPARTDYRHQLATLWEAMGLVERSRGELGLGERAFRRCIELLEELATGSPEHPGYQNKLGGALNNLALILIDKEEYEEALPWIERAIECQKAALRANPGHRSYRYYLANHYWNLASIHLGLEELELAADAARDVRATIPDSGDFLATAARLLARCATLHDEQSLEHAAGTSENHFVEEAIHVLREAITHGYADVQALQESPDLAPLRSHETYEQLLNLAKNSASDG